jgi:uroporphyrinogen decarboxylase
MDTMTPRERIMTALRNGTPDRVPATPDTSIMIPCRLQRKPFWEMEVNENPPLWKAYIEAVKHFGTDGWMFNGRLDLTTRPEVRNEWKVVKKTDDRWEVRGVYHTPDGDLTYTNVTPRDNPTTMVEHPVKDIERDFKKLRHFFTPALSADATVYRQQREEMGERGMICIGVGVPGFQSWLGLFQGGLEALTYAYEDHPDLFAELVELHDRHAVRCTELAIDAGIESILTGGSGSITLQSPELFRKLSLPTLRKITRMCRQAGVICGIHSCGKERALVQACAEETELDYVNPLEIAPMGDCDLAECKRLWGNRLALMGNLHTTDVMLRGTVTDVRRESLRAILAAGGDGGFVLSTGDQCGRDTPEENVFEIVRVAKELGAYPLDRERIRDELRKLGGNT